MATIHLIVKGKVQGVFYRATTKKVARQAGITGWVKNLPNGDVEIMATGSQEVLQQFVDWCCKGPLGAKVDEIITTDVEEQLFDHFTISG